MADLKDDVIFIARMLTNLQERIKDIKNNYGVNIWGVDDFLVKDVFVLAKVFDLKPEISNIDTTYGHTKMVKIEIEGITFTSVYTKEEYEEYYKRYTEVESNV
jgi:hypothetical protein